MAKRKQTKKKGTFSHSGRVALNFYGMEELVQKIVDAGGKVEPALRRSIKASAVPIEKDLRNFMAKHYKTGETISSLTSIQEIEGLGSSGYITYKLGFDIKKGGLPALFLDIGTPKITPSFFVYYAFQNNLDNSIREQENALKEVLEELM